MTWHDFVNNPEDVPKKTGNILALIKKPGKKQEYKVIKYNARCRMFDTAHIVIAWQEIEPFVLQERAPDEFKWHDAYTDPPEDDVLVEVQTTGGNLYAFHYDGRWLDDEGQYEIDGKTVKQWRHIEEWEEET